MALLKANMFRATRRRAAWLIKLGNALIYLESQNLLFLKTRKTGGTSFEIALSRHAAPQDIVTPISFEDELLRKAAGGVFPQNWARSSETEITFHAAVCAFEASENKTPARHQMKPFREQAFYFNHFGPDIVPPRMGANKFDRALKITICRHPYEQLVSHAFFQQRFGNADFEKVVNRLLANPSPNASLYLLGEKPVIDVFIRYENLADDITALEHRTGLDLLSAMPRAKGQFRADRRPAKDLLSDAQKARCYQINRWEFETLGYTA